MPGYRPADMNRIRNRAEAERKYSTPIPPADPNVQIRCPVCLRAWRAASEDRQGRQQGPQRPQTWRSSPSRTKTQRVAFTMTR